MLADFNYKKYQDILVDNCEKILIIDFDTDTYKPIKIEDKDINRSKGMNYWFVSFANSDQVCEKDKRRFLDFANINTIKETLRAQKRTSIVYRRENPERWCIMTIFKTDDENEALLIVVDIENIYINAVESRIDKRFGSKNDLFDYVEGLRNDAAAVGLAVFESEKSSEMLEPIAYYYPYTKSFIYDDSHIVIVVRDITAGQFQIEVASAYKCFNSYNIKIGYTWQDDDWDTNRLIAKAITNLQNNYEVKENENG